MSTDPKKSVGVLCKEPAVKYALVQECAGETPIAKACRALGVRRTGYYAWESNQDCPRRVYDKVLEVEIKNVFYENHRIFGARKIRAVIAERGHTCSRRRVRRIMDAAGLNSVVRRKFKATTNSKHGLPVADNLLNQRFFMDRPNLAWVSDITYIGTGEGWLYLCAVIDLFSRKVVGWAASSTMTRQLVIDALSQALRQRNPEPGLIVHTDRGSQFCSHDYQRVLRQAGARSSMSASGNPYDDACAESFFRSLKTECVYQFAFQTRAQALDRVRWYIELFYNRNRPHASMGYRSPAQFEASA